MTKLFVEPSQVLGNTIEITDKGDIRHIIKVLRLRKGDALQVSDSAVWEYDTEIEEISEELVVLKICDKQKFAKEPALQITLFQGIPKAGKMELIVQKSVELGAYCVVPVFMERTVVTDKGNFGKKIERWQKVAGEAAKQCKRGIVPEVGSAIDFKKMCERLSGFDLVLFPYENEENRSIKDCLRRIADERSLAGGGNGAACGNDEACGNDAVSAKTVAIIIGPEGGFSDKEAEILKGMDVYCVSLGKTILRTETAGLAAIAMTMYELEL